jgi:site-specific DNA-methyltransferase (adenine-specific)
MIEINTIYNEDCLDVMADISDNVIDLTVTSPPYDNLRDYKGYTFDFENIAQELFRITKKGGAVVWVVGDASIKGSETGTSFKQALYFKDIGFNLHDTMIYEKNGFAFPSINRYHQIFEYMFVLSKGKLKTFNPIKDRKNIHQKLHSSTRRNKDGSLTKVKIKNFGLREYGQRYNIWKYSTGLYCSSKYKDAFKHPAIFPEELAKDHIMSWSNEGDIILDPFSGSGTTPVMAYSLNRKYIGIDISKEYCEIAKKRLEVEKSKLL